MNILREQVRRAALQFADTLCDLFAAEIARDPAPPAAPKAAVDPPPVRAAGATTSQTRILAYVREHPGVAPRDIVSGVGINRGTVFEVLSKCCTEGRLRKSGGGRSTAYFAADAPEAPAPAPPAPGPRRSNDDALAGLIAFVEAHPGCRGGEIEAALGVSGATHRRFLLLAKTSGAIRMEGDRFQARYFPGKAPKIVIPPSEPSGAVTASQRRQADALLEEIDDALASQMSADRLRIVLDAVVAELRGLGQQVPADDMLSSVLALAKNKIAALIADRKLGTIAGLDESMSANWDLEAQKSRMLLAAFDRVVEDEAASRKPHRRRPRTE